MRSTNFTNIRTFGCFVLKIRDGLFIGNGESPNQIHFLSANKITTIINCAASEVLPSSLPPTINLIQYNWLDSDSQTILDPSDHNFNEIYTLISKAHQNFQGVLICSLRAQSRALTITTAFLMRRYRWSLYKTLQFLNSKRSDFEIRAAFLRQLLELEGRMFKGEGCTRGWEEQEMVGDGEVLKNTYINSLMPEGEGEERKRNASSMQRKSVRFEDKAIVINAQEQKKNTTANWFKRCSTPQSIKKPQAKLLNILELHKVISGFLLEKSQTPPNHRKYRVKTQMDERMFNEQSCESPFVRHHNRKRKSIVSPYCAKTNLDRITRINTEPKENVRLSINFKIDNINFISLKNKKNRTFHDDYQKIYASKWTPKFFSKTKTNQKTEDYCFRRPQSTKKQRIHSKNRQKHSLDERKISFIQSVYSEK